MSCFFLRRNKKTIKVFNCFSFGPLNFSLDFVLFFGVGHIFNGADHVHIQLMRSQSCTITVLRCLKKKCSILILSLNRVADTNPFAQLCFFLRHFVYGGFWKYDKKTFELVKYSRFQVNSTSCNCLKSNCSCYFTNFTLSVLLHLWLSFVQWYLMNWKNKQWIWVFLESQQLVML